MTQDRITRQIQRAKSSIMAGDAKLAIDNVDKLMVLLKSKPPADRDLVEARLAELRTLAEAALTGARAAAEHMQEILRTARSLQTYDNHGQRKVADTAAAQPRRF